MLFISTECHGSSDSDIDVDQSWQLEQPHLKIKDTEDLNGFVCIILFLPFWSSDRNIDE